IEKEMSTDISFPMVRHEGPTACFRRLLPRLAPLGFRPLAIREFTELSHFTLAPSRVRVPSFYMLTNRKRDVN
ncbi:hypothetical protein, partial [Emergencia timonensis]|uniref:hypothetical protein n=1 Tax=Emergencia timonensis TaxID=1776384 RepID=UPI0024A9B1B2